MARRRAEIDDDEAETPPWMERDRAAPSRRAPDRADRERASDASHTVITWRALIIGAVLAVAVAIAGVIGVRTLIAREPGAVAGGAPGEVPLIRAPGRPYKVKPAADASGTGLTGDGMGGSGPATAAPEEPGQASEGRIDSGALPEAPQRPERAPTDLLPRGTDSGTDVAPPGAGDAPAADRAAPAQAAPVPVVQRVEAKPARTPEKAPAPVAPRKAKSPPRPKPESDETADAPAPAPKAETKAGKPSAKPADRFELPPEDLAKVAAKPKPEPGTGHGIFQIGAFSTREKAETAWTKFTASHPSLTGLHKQITPIDRDGTTLYRLRATGTRGGDLCATLKGKGEKCLAAK